jgi:hypothetical protein
MGYLRRGKLAELTLTSDPTNHTITWNLTEATDEQDEDEPFRPTYLMERVSHWLERNRSDEPHTYTKITEEVTGKAVYLRDATDRLVEEGYALRKDGPNDAKLVTSIKPFTEALDPGRPPSPTRPSPSQDGVPSYPSPRPTPTRGDGDGTETTDTGHPKNPLNPSPSLYDANDFPFWGGTRLPELTQRQRIITLLEHYTDVEAGLRDTKGTGEHIPLMCAAFNHPSYQQLGHQLRRLRLQHRHLYWHLDQAYLTNTRRRVLHCPRCQTNLPSWSTVSYHQHGRTIVAVVPRVIRIVHPNVHQTHVDAAIAWIDNHWRGVAFLPDELIPLAVWKLPKTNANAEKKTKP